MSAANISGRIAKLESANSNHVPVIVWVNDGESTEKAMARWLAERPGQDPVRDNREVIFISWGTASEEQRESAK